MKATWIVTTALAHAALAAGCTSEMSGAPRGYGTNAERLQTALAPGATMIAPFSALDPASVYVKTWPMPGGGAVVHVGGTAQTFSNAPDLGALVRVGPGGQVTVLETSTTAGDFSARKGVAFGDALLDVGCDGIGSLVSPVAPVQAISVPVSTCASTWVIGEGASPSVVSTFDQDPNAISGGGYRLRTWKLDGGTTFAPTGAGVALGVKNARPNWVRETAPGVFEYVYTSLPDGAVVHGMTGSSETTTTSFTFPDSSTAESFRPDVAGEFLLADGADHGRIRRWRAADGTVVDEALAPGVPSGYGPWSTAYGFGAAVAGSSIPNPYAADLTVPTGWTARSFTAGAFATAAVPNTPCTSDDACREIGETYLVGVAESSAKPVAIYAIWAWLSTAGQNPENQVAIYAAPIDRSAAVTACTPGEARCEDAGTRSTCDASGHWSTAACPAGQPLCTGAGVCGGCGSDAECPAAPDCALARCIAGVCSSPPAASGTPCGGGASVCDGAGTCGVCAPGATECAGATAQRTCGASGQWGADEACAADCTQGGCPAITTLVAGQSSTCAVFGGTSLRCWGHFGGPTPTAIPTPTPAVDGVALGRAHACYFRKLPSAGDSVYCWGEDALGQLGDGGAPSYVATAPQLVSTAPQVWAQSITAGRDHTCVADGSGALVCWGGNDSAQSGQTASATPVTLPTTVPYAQGLAPVAGDLHTCAMRGSDAICFGDFLHGQLGVSLGDNLQLTAAVSMAKAVVAGSAHSCALMVDDSIECWGNALWGQVGTYNSGDVHTPVAAGSGLQSLAAGGNTSCGINVAGDVYCWGANDVGQLGQGSADPNPHIYMLSVALPAAATHVTVGVAHACALVGKTDVYCWGSNAEGQLGDGTLTSRPSPGKVVF